MNLRQRLQSIISSWPLGNFHLLTVNASNADPRLFVMPQTLGLHTTAAAITMRYLMQNAGIKVGPLQFSERHQTCIFSVG